MHKDGCHLKWKRPKDDGGTPIEYYAVEKYDHSKGTWVPCGRSSEPSQYLLSVMSLLCDNNILI